MMVFAAALLAIGVLVFTLLVRARDLPEFEPVSPFKHLEERRAVIYDNLRDLQFEHRVGKLSDPDYQQTKQGLQRELAAVLAAIDAVPGAAPKAAPPLKAPQPGAKAASGAPDGRQVAPAAYTCPHCGAKFPGPMKFCGECGKPMAAEAPAK
ncbi:MAG: hypothetical protein ABSD56_10960 [Bryobacteraceae bacterium]